MHGADIKPIKSIIYVSRGAIITERMGSVNVKGRGMKKRRKSFTNLTSRTALATSPAVAGEAARAIRYPSD
jgi:hypothetical protein